MTEEPTLTDFSGKRTDEEGEETGSDRDDDRAADGDTELATTTYAWGSYVCAECETSTERVWRRGTEDDDTGLVCESCKTW